MAAERREREAAAAAALHGALACLNRGLVKEPFAPGCFARPNVKAMQAALYLLHHRIRGAARTKKARGLRPARPPLELQHVYPVLEPAQAREFKGAMAEWVRELGAGGALQPDTAKYFVSAFQGSATHRAVLMLLDLCALALSKELGEGPQAGLPDADLLLPAHKPPRQAQVAAAAAHRQLQARFDAVVAAMQRLKQLHAQAAGTLAAGQGAAGSAAVELAPRAPPLFAGSQAAARRGDLVQELLAHGPPLTAQPDAVQPGSWGDLLAAGKGGPSGASAAAAAVMTPPLTARRLSNPAQEASNFAAEGLAADADVLTVHGVLVRRLAAAGASLQAACSSGAGPGSAEVRAALAEAAALREMLMLSVRQELAAASLREQHAPPSMLQLLPPSRPPRNPVSEGMQAAEQEAAAADAADSPASSTGVWATPDPVDVRALRQSMWRQLRSGSQASDGVAAERPASPDGVPARSAGGAAAGGDSRVQSGGSRSRSLESPRQRPPAAAADSPSLDALPSNSCSGLDSRPLLAVSPLQGQPSPWQPRLRERQQPSGSPCMAESCASASVMGETGGAASRQASSIRPPLRLAASPMFSASASVAHLQPQRSEQPHSSRMQPHRLQPIASSSSSLAGAAALGAPPSPPLRLLDERSSPAGRPALQSRRSSSGSLDAGSPAPAGSWRQAATAAAATPGQSDSPMSGASSRRRAAFTLTPPRRLEDSPLPMPPLQRQQQQQQQQQPAGLRSGGDATPVSKLYGGSPLHASTPAPSPVLQPLQQPQKQWQRGAATSPGSPLLASCFKSTPALAPSPFADLPTSQQQQRQQQEQQPGSPNWTLPAGRPSRPGAPSADGAGSLDSPRGSAGRRRSAVITTSSPLAPAGSLDGTPLGPAHRPAAGSQRTCEPAAGEDLLAGLKAFSLDSPSLSSLTQPADSRGARTAGGGVPTNASLDELRARMARVQRLNRA